MENFEYNRRVLLQAASPPPPNRVGTGNSSVSFSTAVIVGVIIGGAALLIGLIYIFLQKRKAREVIRAEARRTLEAEQHAARAERRRKRLEAKGVPASVVDTFPLREFVPGETPNRSLSGLELSTRNKMMQAAAHALTNPVDNNFDKVSELSLTPAAEVAGNSSILNKITALLSPASGSTRTNAPTGQGAGSSSTPTAWEGEMSVSEQDEDRSLAAAHLASGAAGGLTRAPSAPHRHSISGSRANSLTLDQALPSMSETSGAEDQTLPAPFNHPLSFLPEEQDDDALQCAVCLCDFQSGDMLRQLPCQHDFHQMCIDSWMKQHQTCPLCRHVLYVNPNPTSNPPPRQRSRARRR